MSGPRLAIVSRCFWPVVDDSTLRLQAWLRQFKKLGLDVRLMTALWNYRWPLRCSFDGVTVQRVGPPPLSSRGFKSYLKALVDHLVLHQSQYDTLLFDAATEEAVACCQARELAGKRKLLWFEIRDEAATGMMLMSPVVLEACRLADQVLVQGAAEERLLRSGGVTATKIDRLGQVEVPHVSRSPGDRSRARGVLREACGDLFVPPDGRIIVVPTLMQNRPALDMLLQAIDPLLDRWPSMRLWFIGDGPERSRIYERIRDMEGARQIALPGCFDAVEELMQVADACVLTTPGEGLGYFAPLAWANGITCLLPVSTLAKERTPSDAKWGTYFPGNMPQLRDLLIQVVESTADSLPSRSLHNQTSEYGADWSMEKWRRWGTAGSEQQEFSTAVRDTDQPISERLWKKWNG